MPPTDKRTKFTDKFIVNLKPREARYELREDNAHGNGTLAIRVTPNGHRSWQYLYRFNGEMRRMTLGSYPQMSVADAHAAVGAAMQKRERGIDPGAETVAANAADRGALTFAQLSDRYLEEWARPHKRPKSVAGDDRTLKADLLPTLGKRKAEAIQTEEIKKILKGIVARGAPIQANRTLALVRAMFNWARDEKLIRGENPCAGLKPPCPENERERVLEDGEIKRFFALLPTAAMLPQTRLVLQLVLATAQRCGEVVGACWSEIDEDAGWWTIPSAKAKNKSGHRVPLSPLALALLQEARGADPDRKHVFPSPRGDAPIVENAIARAVARNADHFGFGEKFTPHDLRRTAATRMGDMGVTGEIVEKLLNHVEPKKRRVYNRSDYAKEKRAAIDLWGEHLCSLRPTPAVPNDGSTVRGRLKADRPGGSRE
jgi:integrase